MDGRINGRPRLTAVVDGRSPMDRIEWSGAGSHPAPYFGWDTGTENRTARLEVCAYDTLGQHGTLTRDIVLDNTGPAITSMAPAHRALVRGAQFRATF